MNYNVMKLYNLKLLTWIIFLPGPANLATLIFLINLTFFNSFNRCLATAAKPNEASAKERKSVVKNLSFMANIFRGKVESAQVFPYPYNLTEEESETLSMVVDPVERFFSVNEFKKN